VLNQYGQGLNRCFFKPYTEKLFGIPASRLSPAWARRKPSSGLEHLVRGGTRRAALLLLSGPQRLRRAV